MEWGCCRAVTEGYLTCWTWGLGDRSLDNEKLWIWFVSVLWCRVSLICLFVGGVFVFLSECLEGWSLEAQIPRWGVIMQVQGWDEEIRMTRLGFAHVEAELPIRHPCGSVKGPPA